MKKLSFWLVGLFLGVSLSISASLAAGASGGPVVEAEKKGATLQNISADTLEFLKTAGIDQDLAKHGVENILAAHNVTNTILGDHNPKADPNNPNLRVLVAAQSYFGDMLALLDDVERNALGRKFGKLLKDLATLKTTYSSLFDDCSRRAAELK